MRQLWPICTWLSIFTPLPITVSVKVPQSMVVAAPTTTSSPTTTPPSWAIVSKRPFSSGAKPKPSAPSTAPAWMTQRAPTRTLRYSVALLCTTVRWPTWAFSPM